MGHKIRSKLAVDCIVCMNELAETKEVKLWSSAMGKETAEHLTCWCPAWEAARTTVFGKSPVQVPQEVKERDLASICSFLRCTGRLKSASMPDTTHSRDPQQTATALPYSTAADARGIQQIGRDVT